MPHIDPDVPFITDLANTIAAHAQQAISATGVGNALMQFDVCRRVAEDLQLHNGTSHEVTPDTWRAVVAVWPAWSGWVAKLTEKGIDVRIPGSR